MALGKKKHLNIFILLPIEDFVKKYIKNQPSAWGLLVSPEMKESLKVDETVFDQK